ncbi:hypothetical protein HD806DRAFT_552245 [Xylariaceae sp. AK1471]|nr:hypothetical protein HD806DRAFT_552245 [Xylariaceae sp. AK1471]
MADYSKMKVVNLKTKLERLGLPKNGLKAELVARLEAATSKDSATGMAEPPARASTKTNGRKNRQNYPSSWGFDEGSMTMKKRVLTVFDGPRCLTTDDMMLSTEHEVRVKLSDGRSYVTDLDVNSMRRAEGFLNATPQENSSWLFNDMRLADEPLQLQQSMGSNSEPQIWITPGSTALDSDEDTRGPGKIPVRFLERSVTEIVEDNMLGAAPLQENEARESHNLYGKLDYEPTDSGYASLPNVQRPPNNRNDAINFRQDSLNTLFPLSCDDKSDVGTVFSTTTSIIPEIAQSSIICICEDIYNNIRLETDSSHYEIIVDNIPELIKAFAVRLGSCSSHEINWRIMHFVYIHHNEISSILREKLADDDDHGSEINRSDNGAMSLVDKISLWMKDHRESQIGDNDPPERFEGVDDLENEELLSATELSIYSKVILDSAAYKWLLNTMRNKLTLEWGNMSNIMDKIRRTILRILRPGKICRSQPPKTFTTTFVFRGHLLHSLKAELQTTIGSCRVLSLADIRILTASGDADLQVSTIGQYLHRVWPEFGTKLLDGFQRLFDEDPASKYPVSINFVYEASMQLFFDGVDICAHVHGPAYFVAQCAEQLAWLEAAMRLRRVSASNYNPSLLEIGELEFLVQSSPAVSTSSSLIPWFMLQERSCSGFYFSTLVSGYPTSHRPEGFSGVELALDFPDSSARVYFHPDSGRATLQVGSLIFSFVKRTANVWLWHVVNSIHSKCLCQTSSGLDAMAGVSGQWIIDIAAHQRHIIGDCGTSVTRNAVSGYEGYLDRLTMPHIKDVQLVDDGKSLTECDSPSNSLDSDLLSFSSFSEDGARDNILKEGGLIYVVNIVATRLLTECNIRATPLQPAGLNDWDSSNSCKKSSAGCSYSQQADNNQFAQISLQKRKANKRAEDDENDDVPERQPFKKSRYEIDPQQKLFACPYWKTDPTKYRACFRLKLLTSSRVKQHLSRNHTPRFYCQICYLIFIDKQAQEAHIIQRSCSRESGARFDGILPEQHDQLSRKPKLALSEKQKWFLIWEIVFPEERQPVSPYIDSQLADCCATFREHWQNRGAEILFREIRDSGVSSTQTVDEDERQQLLQEVLARGLNMIWESWNAPTALSQSKLIPLPMMNEPSTSVLPRGLSTTVFADGTTPASSFVDSALGYMENSTGSSSTADAYPVTALFPSYVGTFIPERHDANSEAPVSQQITQSFLEAPLWTTQLPDFMSGLSDLEAYNTPTTIDPAQINSLVPES